MKKTSLPLFMMLLPLMASADEMVYSVIIDRICYNLNKTAKTAEVTYKDMVYNTYGYQVTIPSSVTYSDETYSVTGIGKDAFWGAPSLTSVEIPSSVTYIGVQAFGMCERLTSEEIPNGVTSIAKNAFYKCTNLKAVVLPGSLTSVDENVFANCSSLKDVYCLAEDVPETATMAFNLFDASAATLYVPTAAVEKYEAAAPWNGFGSIVGIDATEVRAVDAAKAEKKIAEIFSLDGKPQNELRKGINIVKYSDGTTRKVIKM